MKVDDKKICDQMTDLLVTSVFVLTIIAQVAPLPVIRIVLRNMICRFGYT